uniref:Uncharacterized protein n=1 Tax=Lepeophtheirus salmonis TaxID=72036 RepID=A0A0K2SZR0_LEPSM
MTIRTICDQRSDQFNCTQIQIYNFFKPIYTL